MIGDHAGLAEASRLGLLPRNVRRAVVHGNPDRVTEQAKLLEYATKVAEKRGFTTYAGKFHGVDVLISSIGMGTGSAAIVIEELRDIGIDKIIRIGTCGAYLRDMKPGDLAVPTASLVDSSALRYISPDYLHNWSTTELPPWASMRDGFVFVDGFDEVKNAITKSLDEEVRGMSHQFEHKYSVGPIHDKDVLHAWREEFSLRPTELTKLKEKVKGITIATDMETGALFTISHLRSMRSGSILTAVDFLADEEKVKAQDEGLQIAYRASLTAITRL